LVLNKWAIAPLDIVVATSGKHYRKIVERKYLMSGIERFEARAKITFFILIATGQHCQKRIWNIFHGNGA